MDKVFNQKEFLLRSLVHAIKLECFLKFVFGAFIFANRSQDETPDDPVVSVLRLLLYSFPDLLDSFHHITLLKLSEGPMHVGVVSVSIELFCLTADIECLFVNHVHVEQESKVVVGKRVCVVDKDALLEVLDCLGVVSNLEV